MLFNINKLELSKSLTSWHIVNLTQTTIYKLYDVQEEKNLYFENLNVYTSSEYSTFFQNMY